MELWKKVDCLLFRNFHDHWKDPTINKYLETNASEKFEGYLIVRKNKKPLWISHPFNHKQAKRELKNVKVITFDTKKELESIIRKSTGKKVGINGEFIAHNRVKALKRILKGKKIIDAGKEIENEREIKSAQEIKKIRKAVRETKKAIAFAKNNLSAGKTEEQVKEEIERYLKDQGCTTAFCIVAFGKNTSHIHYVSGNTKLKQNQPVLIDAGARFEGYCGDITESFWFGKKEGKEFKKFEHEKEKIEQAQKEIEKILKPGVTAKKLYIAGAKKAGKIPHAIGHGLGIEVHDIPHGISEKSNWKLKEGMVLAIEPAIYNKKLGVRLEKDYLITKKGYEEL